jgi:hypothetical protein
MEGAAEATPSVLVINLFSDTTHRVPVAANVVVCGVDIDIVEVQVVRVAAVARIRRCRPTEAEGADISQRPIVAIAGSGIPSRCRPVCERPMMTAVCRIPLCACRCET